MSRLAARLARFTQADVVACGDDRHGRKRRADDKRQAGRRGQPPARLEMSNFDRR
jgi:hypothetical protein